jgi:hypothetical protein
LEVGTEIKVLSRLVLVIKRKYYILNKIKMNFFVGTTTIPITAVNGTMP